MFGGMMDPETMRLAQEQMSRMGPEDLQKMQQQMFRNPELVRMASEGLKNIRPDELRMAAEQMKNIPPEQIADMSSRMANASPEEIASMRARSEAQRSYEYQGALSLKTQGNQLHGCGKYSEAAEKYCRAKNNLVGIITPEAKNLRLTCGLNLMSCYLKTNQYQEVVAEGTEVLKGEPNNLKALYRRGQAYKELRQFKLAVADLRNAAEISPEDETVTDMLRQARDELEHQQGGEEELSDNGPIIEEITDEEAEKLSQSPENETAESSDNGSAVTDNAEHSSTTNGRQAVLDRNNVMGEGLSALAQNPEMLRSMQSMISTMSPEHLAAMSGGGMTPEMAKMASNMFKTTPPETLEKMMGTASQFQPAGGDGPQTRSSSLRPTRQSSTSGSLSASTGSNDSASESGPAETNRGLDRNSCEGMPSMADFSPEVQERMRQQMKDPAMKEMMASMMKNISPETMANMSQQMGLKMSPEEAAQAQKAMAGLSPDDLDRIMRWVDGAQKLAARGKQARNWLLGRPGIVLALLMLLLAITLHWLGYIG